VLSGFSLRDGAVAAPNQVHHVHRQSREPSQRNRHHHPSLLGQQLLQVEHADAEEIIAVDLVEETERRRGNQDGRENAAGALDEAAQGGVTRPESCQGYFTTRFSPLASYFRHRFL